MTARCVLASGLLLALAASTAAQAGEAARIRGEVTLQLTGATLSDLGPIVVFLEPVGAPPAQPRRRTPNVIHQKDASFAPPFLAIAVGEAVRMVNDDAIYHNVFSYSRPNDFDLGLYPSGESRTVVLEYAGVVKTYCSIHESMNGTIFVAPSRHFAVATPSGRFELTGVPPGRYRIRTWCEKLPIAEREIRLRPGDDLVLELPLVASPG